MFEFIDGLTPFQRAQLVLFMLPLLSLFVVVVVVVICLLDVLQYANLTVKCTKLGFYHRNSNDKKYLMERIEAWVKNRSLERLFSLVDLIRRKHIRLKALYSINYVVLLQISCCSLASFSTCSMFLLTDGSFNLSFTM